MSLDFLKNRYDETEKRNRVLVEVRDRRGAKGEGDELIDGEAKEESSTQGSSREALDEGREDLDKVPTGLSILRKRLEGDERESSTLGDEGGEEREEREMSGGRGGEGGDGSHNVIVGWFR